MSNESNDDTLAARLARIEGSIARLSESLEAFRATASTELENARTHAYYHTLDWNEFHRNFKSFVLGVEEKQRNLVERLGRCTKTSDPRLEVAHDDPASIAKSGTILCLTKLSARTEQGLSIVDPKSNHDIELFGRDALRFKPEEGDCDPIVIISLPKAGTYFLSEILERMNIINTEVHLSFDQFSDYRNMTASEKKAKKKDIQRFMPIALSASFVGRGQFAVGHLSAGSDVRAALHRHRKIFLYRDIRACTVSYVRFVSSTGRDGAHHENWAHMTDGREQLQAFLRQRGENFFKYFLGPVTSWYGDPDVFAITYETLMGDRGSDARRAELSRLFGFLGVPCSEDEIDMAISTSIGAETKTYSGARTDLSQYWSDEVEEIFRQLGGLDLNSRLGFA